MYKKAKPSLPSPKSLLKLSFVFLSTLKSSKRKKDSFGIDCKTVFSRIFAYSSTREQSCEARTLRALKTLTPRFTDFFTDFEKKNRLFCSLLLEGY